MQIAQFGGNLSKVIGAQPFQYRLLNFAVN